MLAKVHSCALIGLDGAIVEVEADLNSRALPSVTLVGLPDAAVKESTERVRAAIINSGLRYPAGPRHGQPGAGRPAQGRPGLRPADRGRAARCWPSRFPPDLDGCLFLGELSLDGSLRHVNGVLPMAHLAQELGYQVGVRAAEPTRPRPRWSRASTSIPVDTLGRLAAHLRDYHPIEPYRDDLRPGRRTRRRTPATSRISRGRSTSSARWRWRRPAGTTVLMTRPARRGQDAAGALDALDPAAADAGRGAGRHAHLLRRGHAARAGIAADHAPPALPRAAPHDLARRAGRRRAVAAAGRDQPGAPRRAVPRRDAGVRPAHAGGAAPAAGRQGRHDQPGAGQPDLSRPTSCWSRRRNPCPCGYFGDPERPCSCSPAMVSKYQKRAVRPAARPHRHPRRGAARAVSEALRRAARRVVGGDPGACGGGAGAADGPLRVEPAPGPNEARGAAPAQRRP